MPTLPPLDNNVNHAPHVVLLGAGASIAAYLHWGRKGPRLPSMQDLIEVLSLRSVIEDAGCKTAGLNFEAFYDDLSSSGKNEDLRTRIESRVYDFFGSLTLPDEPTIYDYIILSLREKDIIATFNWDPFLLQAYMRNEVVTKTRRPRITFLHGNVKVGVCRDCEVAGVNGRRCSRCGTALTPSKLLHPVKHKNYNDDPFIKTEWEVLRHKLSRAYFLTIFGYRAPTTDVEARSLMLEVWKAVLRHPSKSTQKVVGVLIFAGLSGAVIRLEKVCSAPVEQSSSSQAAESTRMPNNAINTDGKLARAFGVHEFAAGYGGR